MTRKQKGFTLIELLIVVAIIGILAAIAIPNLLTAMQRSKQKRTMADMRSAATAWEAFATDTNTYWPSGVTIPTQDVTGTLPAKLQPTYIKQLPLRDGWENPFEYRSESTGAAYVIISYGKDKASQVGTGASITGGGTTDFDNDIVYSNGSFVQYPQGIQTQ